MKIKTKIKYSPLFKENQKIIDRIKYSDQNRIISFLKDFKEKTILNSISKAPLLSEKGNSKLKLLHELYFFTVKNFVEKIFLPSLNTKIRDKIFMFSFGRLFSKYNDIGVQACTDFDFNIIYDETLESNKEMLMRPLFKMKDLLWNEFSIEAEINPRFSVISFEELKHRISGKSLTSLQYLMFYKSIENNYYVFSDNPKIRFFMDQRMSELKDILIFEQFLGLYSSHRNSFFRIKKGDALEIIPDNDTKRIKVSNVIGSIPFRRRLKTGNLIILKTLPEEWYFSMKYMVNRVYDYICAMKAKGIFLFEIGLAEHDYNFIREVNLIMLILQELKYNQLSGERFGVQHKLYDFSYISSQRIHFFSSIHPLKFLSALKRIIYELNVVPRSEDFDRIESLIKKKQYIHVLWIICSSVEYWITRKLVKILKSQALKDLASEKNYQDFLQDKW